MIQESYVTFEQAKALKELGFPQKIGVLGDQFKDDPTVYYKDGEYYNKVTLSLAQKWLREEKNIYIVIQPCVRDITKLHKKADYFEGSVIYEDNTITTLTDITYELTESCCIDKCIELLKQ